MSQNHHHGNETSDLLQKPSARCHKNVMRAPDFCIIVGSTPTIIQSRYLAYWLTSNICTRRDMIKHR